MSPLDVLTQPLNLLFVVPLLGIAAILLLPMEEKTWVRRIGSTAGLFTLADALWLFFQYDRGVAGLQFQTDASWIPSLGIRWNLGVDGISVVLDLLTAFTLFCGCLVSYGIPERVKEFYILLLTLAMGVFGVFSTQDLFFFYFFYELAVIPMFLLIGVWGSGDKVYATYKLTLYLTAGAVLALLGVLAVYFEGSRLVGHPTASIAELTAALGSGNGAPSFSLAFQRWVFPLLLFGFGAIAPLWPFHSWSPIGHAAAPAAGSMMHAGVLMKLGSYAILRLGLGLLPQGAQAWLPLVAVLCCFNMIYGGLVAMAQKDLKFMIGYSSSSHMGYVLLGLAALTPTAVNGAVFLMFAHGLMTALAFALIGFFYDQTHTRMVPDLGGLAKQIPFIGTAFVFMALASAGLPGFANFVSELLVLLGSWERYPIPTILGALGVVISATYLLRAVRSVFFGERIPRWDFVKDATTPFQKLPYLILLTVLLLTGFFPGPVLETIESGVLPILARLGS